jgi:hypothetical protein
MPATHMQPSHRWSLPSLPKMRCGVQRPVDDPAASLQGAPTAQTMLDGSSVCDCARAKSSIPRSPSALFVCCMRGRLQHVWCSRPLELWKTTFGQLVGPPYGSIKNHRNVRYALQANGGRGWPDAGFVS